MDETLTPKSSSPANHPSSASESRGARITTIDSPSHVPFHLYEATIRAIIDKVKTPYSSTNTTLETKNRATNDHAMPQNTRYLNSYDEDKERN